MSDWISPPAGNIWAVMIVRRILGILSELFCTVLCMTVVHSDMHTHMSSSLPKVDCWYSFRISFRFRFPFVCVCVILLQVLL